MQISRTGTCNRQKGPAGFTLLELIVVVFIISLTAAVVMPSFYRQGTDSLRADSRRLASLLRYLNDSAIYSKQSYILNFDLQEKSLAWKGPEGDKTEKLKSLDSIILQSKGKVKEGQVRVIFSQSGLQENMEIQLTEGENVMRVLFSYLSGRVKIVDYVGDVGNK